MPGFPKTIFLTAVVILCASSLQASEMPPQQRLQNCLKKAADMPDLAMAEANAWLKKKGGEPALVCRATAQFNRGEYEKSAQDFAQLASGEKDARQSSLLYRQAALAYTRSKNFVKSEEEYGKALKLEQQDPELWVDRANARAAAQRYWTAIEDLDQALNIMPDMMEALRLRGQTWFKLGFEAKAESDFRHVAQLQAEDDVRKSKIRPVAVTKKTQ